MDKVKYKGEYALLLDTTDLVGHRWFDLDIRKAMDDYKVKHLLVITSLPIHSLPLSIRSIISGGDQVNCYRGEIK
jgi:hypothetical protein